MFLLAALVATVALPRGVDAATAVLKVMVTNDAAHPVPVSGSVSVSNFSAKTLWEGQPYAEYRLNTNIEFEECNEYPIPEGKVLFVTRVVADFDMPAGASGTAAARFTPLGAANPIKVPIPATQGGLVGQVDGNRQVIAGALDIGQPVTSIKMCFVSSGGLVGESNVFGYLVPAS